MTAKKARFSASLARAAAAVSSMQPVGAAAAATSILDQEPLNRVIDHTCLNREAVPSDIERLCREAVEHRFYSVCVNGVYVKRAAEYLKATGTGDVKVCAVVGFPLGASSKAAKEAEAAAAIQDGADEVDMVIAVGLLKAGLLQEVKDDIESVAKRCKQSEALLKVIIETCLLTDDEKVTACRLAMEAGADYVKTSTGFSTAGATIDDIKLMHRTVAPFHGKVKASGGIRTRDFALQLREAGASRIGASASVAICKDEETSPSTSY